MSLSISLEKQGRKLPLEEVTAVLCEQQYDRILIGDKLRFR